MIVKANWIITDHGTHSLYEMAAHGEAGYGVWNGSEWMVLPLEDAKEYMAIMNEL